MRIKCIGGPNDDEWHYTQSPDGLYDCVRIYEKQPAISVMNLGAISATSINYNIYIIDCFHFSKDDVYYFLRPSDWTNKQAMLHQFSKRCLQNITE